MEAKIIEVLKDIEGYYIDKGVSWGGTTIIYFPKEKMYERCKRFKCLRTRPIMIEEVDVELISGKTVLIIDDSIDFINALAAVKEHFIYSAYVYVPKIEDNEVNRQILKNNNDIIDEIFTDNEFPNEKVHKI